MLAGGCLVCAKARTSPTNFLAGGCLGLLLLALLTPLPQ
jgi:hypothetical protein